MKIRPGAAGAIALTLALALPGLAGCTSGSSSDSAPAAQAPAVEEVAPEGGAVAGREPGAAAADSAGAGSAVVGRAVITTVETTVEVPDVPAATLKVISATSAAKGYVESQYSAASDPENPTSMLTVRVPGQLLEQFIATVSDLGTVVSAQRSATDVTAEVADIDARLANAKAGVARLRTLMAKAKKIEDIVAIESALSSRQAEAESLAAQQRALAEQTSLATVTVNLTPEQESAPTGFLGGLADGWDAFTTTVSGMARLAGMLLPFALVVAAIVGIVLVAVRRRPGGHAAAVPAQQAVPQQPVTAGAPQYPAGGSAPQQAAPYQQSPYQGGAPNPAAQQAQPPAAQPQADVPPPAGPSPAAGQPG